MLKTFHYNRQYHKLFNNHLSSILDSGKMKSSRSSIYGFNLWHYSCCVQGWLSNVSYSINSGIIISILLAFRSMYCFAKFHDWDMFYYSIIDFEFETCVNVDSVRAVYVRSLLICSINQDESWLTASIP